MVVVVDGASTPSEQRRGTLEQGTQAPKDSLAHMHPCAPLAGQRVEVNSSNRHLFRNASRFLGCSCARLATSRPFSG